MHQSCGHTLPCMLQWRANPAAAGQATSAARQAQAAHFVGAGGQRGAADPVVVHAMHPRHTLSVHNALQLAEVVGGCTGAQLRADRWEAAVGVQEPALGAWWDAAKHGTAPYTTSHHTTQPQCPTASQQPPHAPFGLQLFLLISMPGSASIQAPIIDRRVPKAAAAGDEQEEQPRASECGTCRPLCALGTSTSDQNKKSRAGGVPHAAAQPGSTSQLRRPVVLQAEPKGGSSSRAAATKVCVSKAEMAARSSFQAHRPARRVRTKPPGLPAPPPSAPAA